MNMKILITGATGFIGIRIIDALLAGGMKYLLFVVI